MTPNKAVPDFVWKAWDELPSMTIPQRGTSPVKRLVSLALALSTGSEAAARPAAGFHPQLP